MLKQQVSQQDPQSNNQEELKSHRKFLTEQRLTLEKDFNNLSDMENHFKSLKEVFDIISKDNSIVLDQQLLQSKSDEQTSNLISSLKEQLRDAKQSLENNESTTSSLKSQVDQLSAKNESLVNTIKLKDSDFENQINVVKINHQHELNQLNDLCQQSKKDHQEDLSRLNQLKSINEELENELSQIKKDLAEVTIILLDLIY